MAHSAGSPGRLLLFEECPAGLDHGPHDLLVALTPLACYQLTRLRKPHAVPSDFASESVLAGLEDRYWEEQLEWLDHLDQLLWREIPALEQRGIRAASLYGYFLKISLDILFIRGFELAALLDQGYRQVILWRREVVEPPLDSTLLFRGPSVYSRLLPQFCRARGMGYQARAVPGPSAVPAVRRPGTMFGVPVRHRARRLLHDIAQFREAAIRTVGLSRRPDPGPRLTLLFRTTGYDLGPLLRAARGSGHRCLLMDGDRVVDVTGLVRRTVTAGGAPDPRSAASDRSGDASEWTDAAHRTTAPESTIWRWPNAWYDLPLSEILAPRLAYWMTSVVPRLAALTDRFVRLLRDEQIDFVVAPHIADLSTCAAIAAARTLPRSRSVHIEHGDSLLALKVWDLLNLFHFDDYFVPHAEVAAYFRSRRECYARPTAQVHVGSYRWQSHGRRARAPQMAVERSRRGAANGDPGRRRGSPPPRPIVVYLLTGTGGDARYLNSAWYPDPWYYQLQTRIVDVFAGRDDYTFVVKLFPSDGHILNPIAEYVRDLGRKHIRVSRAPFTRWLPRADRVIIDFPSTGLYETAVAGVPFHLLLHAKFRFRPAALEPLRPWTTIFTQTQEAVQAVEQFLRGDVTRGQVLHPEGADILRTLEGLAGRTGEAASGGPVVHD